MKHVTLVRDMALVDTYDEAEGRVVAAFSNQRAALETRQRLEARRHPQHDIGYRYHFDLQQITVHDSAFTDEYIAAHLDPDRP